MNADALPATEGVCNVFQCSYSWNATAPVDSFVGVDDVVVALEELGAPAEIVGELEDAIDNGMGVLMASTSSTTSTTTTTSSTSSGYYHSQDYYQDFYYYYVCGNPTGGGANGDWYVSPPEYGGWVENPCTIGTKYEDVYLVGEWGSGTEVGLHTWTSGSPCGTCTYGISRRTVALSWGPRTASRWRKGPSRWCTRRGPGATTSSSRELHRAGSHDARV
jgi:hypothetical protein